MSGFPFPSSSSGDDESSWGQPEDAFQTVSLVAPGEAIALFETLAQAGIRFRFEPTRTALPGGSLSGSGVDRAFSFLPLEDCFLLEVHEDDLPAYEALRPQLEPVPEASPGSAGSAGDEPPSSLPEEPRPDRAAVSAGVAAPRARFSAEPAWVGNEPADSVVFRDLGSLFIALGLFLWLIALFQLPDAAAPFGPGHGSWNGAPWVGWGLAALVIGGLFRFSVGLESSRSPADALGRDRQAPADAHAHEPWSGPGHGPRPQAAATSGPPPERIVVLKCLSCGTHNPEDSNFCRHCGAKY